MSVAYRCDCNFVQFAEVGGRTVEIHHQIPAGDADHVESQTCGCGPLLHWLSAHLAVCEHIDQNPRPSD